MQVRSAVLFRPKNPGRRTRQSTPEQKEHPDMEHALPTSTTGLHTEHPLAGLRRPVPSAIVVLIGVLVLIGWTAEQVVTLVAVLLPAGGVADARP